MLIHPRGRGRWLWLLCLCWVGTAVPDEPPADDYLSSLRAFRAAVDYRFRDRILSPLPEAERLRFAGLDYFAVDPALALTARLAPARDRSPFAMPTFDKRTLSYSHYGTLTARVGGEEIRLEAFAREEGMRAGRILLVPFRDATNGAETYAGGRYIEIALPVGETLLLDFNRAMNPWCAYDPSYACPIPPPENHLRMPIRAGERKFR